MEMRFAATARNGDTVQTGRKPPPRKAYEDLTGLDEQVVVLLKEQSLPCHYHRSR